MGHLRWVVSSHISLHSSRHLGRRKTPWAFGYCMAVLSDHWLFGYLLLRFDRLVTCVPFNGLFFVQCDKSRGLGLAPMLLRLEKGNGLKRQWSLIRQVIFENTLAFKLSPLPWIAKSSPSFAGRLIWRIVLAMILRRDSWRAEALTCPPSLPCSNAW